MNVLHLMIDGALAAGELLALLFVSPEIAAEPLAAGAPPALERAVQMHRMSTAFDVRLLGSLATLVDRGDCGEPHAAGHARLSEDEAIADALQFAPRPHATAEVVAAPSLPHRTDDNDAVPSPPLAAGTPRVALLERDDGAFLLFVPHRRASAATLVLRPLSSAATVLQLGAVDPRLAILVPLAGRARLGELADGAIEIELTDGDASYWTTVVAELIDGRAEVQARDTE